MRVISVRQAIREAMREEMLRDDKVFLIGESLGPYGGCFKVTEGMWQEFGDSRIMDTPLSESAIVGCGVGAAMMGFKPIVELMFADFVTIGMDQLVNNAAKMKYLHDGDLDFSMVLRMPQGAGATMGPHHSQSVESWIMNVPGLKIVLPSNAYDAKGLFKSAVRDNNPVVFLEHKLLYNETGEVPAEEYTVPLGKARVVREGRDITLIAYSYMIKISLQAADLLAKEGIEAEVVDVRTIRPLDVESLAASVKKTEKAVIVHEAPLFGGAGGEIAAALQEAAFDYLDAPIGRVGALETPVPYSQPLEQAHLPNARKIVDKVRQMVTHR